MMPGKLTKAILKVASEPIKRIIQKRREEKLKREVPTITKDRIANDIRKLGLKSGDIVNLHSAMKSIGYVESGAKTVLEAIIDVITPEGTMMVPTFFMKDSIYKTCLDKDYIFDPRVDGTILGAIPSAILRFPGVCRSIHPTHSVSAVGKHAKYITEAHHLAASTWGPDSPWDRLVKLDGKLLHIGLKMGSKYN